MARCKPTRCIAMMVLAFCGVVQVSPAADSTAAMMDMTLEDLMKMEVTVASKRGENISEAPGIISVITAQQIRDFGCLSLYDVLEMAPSFMGVSSHLWVNNKFAIRGDLLTHNDNHTLILLNGRPLREGISGGWNFPVYRAFPIDMIDKVEIIRGPGSVIYGTNAFAGVVNITTKKPIEGWHCDVSAAGGSFATGTGDLSATYSEKDLAFSIGGRGLYSQGWDFKAKTRRGAPPTPANVAVKDASMNYGSTEAAVYANLAWKDLKIDGYYSYVKNDILGILPNWQEKGNTNAPFRIFADAQYTFKLPKEWSIIANLTFNSLRAEIVEQNDFAPTQPHPKTSIHQDFSTLFEAYALGQLVKSIKWNLLVGGLLSNSAQPQPDPKDTTLVGAKLWPIRTSYSLMNYSGYIQTDITPVKYFKLIAGAQANKPEIGDADVVPRVGAIINATDFLGAKVLYGQAFRSATPSELYIWNPPALIGDSTLTPEKIATIDAQLFFRMEKVQTSATYFNSKYTNLIARTAVTRPVSSQQYINKGELTVQGFEWEGQIMPVKNLMIMGSGTYQRNSNEDSAFTKRVYIPKTMAKAGVTYTFNFGLSIGVMNEFFGQPPSNDQPALNPKPKSVDFLNASIGYKLPVKLPVELRVTCNNILNTAYDYPEFSKMWYNSLPMGPGFSIYGGVALHF